MRDAIYTCAYVRIISPKNELDYFTRISTVALLFIEILRWQISLGDMRSKGY